MKRLPQQVSLLAVSVFAVSLMAVVPVSAIEGTEDTATTTTQQTESTTTTQTRQKRGTGDGTESRSREVQTAAVTTKESSVEGARDRALKKLAEERQDHKTKSLEARQKSCEARKAALVKKTDNFSRNATKHLAVFNSIYDKVLAFQEEKQLTADNFAELKATVEAKKAAATTAAAAIKDLDTAIDCTSDDPAAAVATLKETVASARKALHDYRLAIKDLVVGLQNAAGSTETETETGTETETTTGGAQ